VPKSALDGLRRQGVIGAKAIAASSTSTEYPRRRVQGSGRRARSLNFAPARSTPPRPAFWNAERVARVVALHQAGLSPAAVTEEFLDEREVTEGPVTCERAEVGGENEWEERQICP
jgi:hypothetical protein